MLKNDLHEKTWFYDLEWIPDPRGAKRLLDLAEEMPDHEAMDALWKHCGADDDNPRPFVKYLFSRVVSIAFLSRNIVFRDGSKTVEFQLYSLPKLPLNGDDTDEAYIINRFLHYIGQRDPYLVGYNSAASDLQVLIQRSLVNEITAPKFCLRPSKPWEGRDYFYKYSEEHLDLLALLSNSGKMTPRLDELAKLCGYPGKIDVDGKQVVDLWLAGDLRKIVEYNQIDVLNTYLIWLRIVYFCGKLTDEKYHAELSIFRSFLEDQARDPEKGHIREFIDAWQE
ncbi:MAG TPA: ribonuclease H-like domain-containing protein [Pyrinomonadaceae bacterium]|nr:ribonuclease H-like domain-containing protein [Pyrinomonadaceae bacterium]